MILFDTAAPLVLIVGVNCRIFLQIVLHEIERSNKKIFNIRQYTLIYDKRMKAPGAKGTLYATCYKGLGTENDAGEDEVYP
jgi:hypothetical protein